MNVPPPVVFQPVEIVFKPSPVYTEEARRLGIQGQVALSVIFQATGAIKVLSIIKSLGHGLDESAEQAATQIRFKPAQRDGKPADFPATLRIEFRLADQSS
jgi:TonB family protein